MVEASLSQVKQLAQLGATIRVFPQGDYTQQILVTEEDLILGGAYVDAAGSRPSFALSTVWLDPSESGERAAQKTNFEAAMRDGRVYDESYETRPVTSPQRPFEDQSKEAAKAMTRRRASS